MKLSEAVRTHFRRQQGTLLQGLLMIGVMVLCGYMIADQWDDLRYDLSSQPLLDLGRVEGSEPGAVVGARDLYVRIHGITSSRGAVVKAGRLGSLLRSDRWYRQMVGAPVFLEIEVESEDDLRARFPVFSEVTAEGRGRQLRASSDYDGIVEFFRQHYGYEIPTTALVVTVDRVPGGSYAALVTVLVLALVALLNVALLAFVLLRKPSVPADATPA